MSLFDNKLHHDMQARRFGAEADRAYDRQSRTGEPVDHVVTYYVTRYRAHYGAWVALVLAEKGEA